MSQPTGAATDDPGGFDPLLAFNAELAAAESPEKPPDPGLVTATPQPEEDSPLQLRLEQAEHSLDNALTEVATLKANVATLVTTVDDIKKQLSRPVAVPIPQPVPVLARARVPKAVAIAAILLTLGAASWGIASVGLVDVPEPPPIESDSSTAPAAPTPTAAIPTPAIPTPAVPTPAIPTPAVTLRTVTNPVPPVVRAPAPRPPAPPAMYVGTLSLDATPGGEVFINRKSAGRTPLRIENLRAGSHLIWIEQEGYRRWTRVVAVAADRVTRVSADLDPVNR